MVENTKKSRKKKGIKANTKWSDKYKLQVVTCVAQTEV